MSGNRSFFETAHTKSGYNSSSPVQVIYFAKPNLPPSPHAVCSFCFYRQAPTTPTSPFPGSPAT